MNSGMIPEEIVFKDTQALFFPALRKPIRENKNKFSLSQISATSNSLDNGVNYLQLYTDSRNLASSIKMHKHLLGITVARVWKWFAPFVVTGIWYRDSRYSQQLILRKVNNFKYELSSNINNEPPLSKKRIRKIARSISRSFGILPIFALGRTAEAGESYHFGSAEEVISFNNNPMNLGIRVVDASSLPVIEPGPITNRIMQNARFITRELLGKFE